jgi:CheY-like chemotaxis protein
MDAHMPVLDGLAATLALREREAAAGAPRCPVIMLTASVLAEDREACLAAGADRFSPKPINWASLYRDMSELCGVELVPAAAPELQSLADSVASGAQDELRAVDLQSALELWGELPVFARMLRQTLDEYSDIVTRVRSLLERAALHELIELMHTLKGVFGNLGCQRIYRTCYAMEDRLKEGDTEVSDLVAVLEAQAALLLQDCARIEAGLSAECASGESAPAFDGAAAAVPLARLKAALELFEVDDDALVALREYLPPQQFAQLEAALDEFDFEAASQLIAALEGGGSGGATP